MNDVVLWAAVYVFVFLAVAGARTLWTYSREGKKVTEPSSSSWLECLMCGRRDTVLYEWRAHPGTWGCADCAEGMGIDIPDPGVSDDDFEKYRQKVMKGLS
jgi:phage/plasmid primase-like uncharacterized protein